MASVPAALIVLINDMAYAHALIRAIQHRQECGFEATPQQIEEWQNDYMEAFDVMTDELDLNLNTQADFEDITAGWDEEE